MRWKASWRRGDEVGGEDVSPGGKLVDGLLGPGSGEVEGDGALATVVHLEGIADGEGCVEIGVPDLGAVGIALEGFDLNDISTHVGHHGAAGGDSEPVGDLEDSDAFEGRFHSIVSRRGGLGNDTASGEGVSVYPSVMTGAILTFIRKVWDGFLNQSYMCICCLDGVVN